MRKPTQAQKVASYLAAKKTITSVTAIGVLGITRLSAVVHAMNKGLPKTRKIKSRMVNGMNGTYAEYYR